jgi:hypothetical protein
MIIKLMLIASGLSFLILACGDKSFENIPIFELGRESGAVVDFMKNPIKIEDGLFYRKLRENGFDSIYGFAKIVRAVNAREEDFDIILLSCLKEEVHQTLVVTIHPTYQSIIDIMAFDPEKLEIFSIDHSKTMPSFIDILLLDQASKSLRVDTSVIQITQRGAIEEIALCCDF